VVHIKIPTVIHSAGVIALALAMSLGSGCANVPRESVDLSYTLGQDIEALHQSHRDLIARYFDALRAQVNDAVDRVFIPAYINGFVESGKLAQHVRNQRADLIEAWARIAVNRIDKERRARLKPIVDAERELQQMVDAAFDRAIRANAAITAHLNSVVKTQRAQDDILESVGLQGLREKIHGALADASQKAERITGEIGAAKDKIQ